jgi:hypothetical protein
VQRESTRTLSLHVLSRTLIAAGIAATVACGVFSDSDSGGGDTAASRRPRGLSSGQLSVAGIGPGSSEEDIHDALGRPDVASPAHYDASLGDSVSNWTYDGILVDVVGHRVARIRCSATRCGTADGVHVGDPRSRVLKAYGPPRSVETMDNEVLRYAGTVAECTLNFTIRDEAVATIELDCEGS